MNVIIGFGHDGSKSPAAIESDLVDLGRLDGVEYVTLVTGDSTSPQWGKETATWAAFEVADFTAVHRLQCNALLVAAMHDQEAIAFTVGTTDLVYTNLVDFSR